MILERFIHKKQLRQWVPHICGILLLLIMPLLVWEEGNSENLIRWRSHFYSQMFFLLVAFYTNLLLLFPKFYRSDKKLRYVIIQLLFLLVVLFAMQEWFLFFIKNNLPIKGVNSALRMQDAGQPSLLHPRTFDNFFFLLLISALSTSLSIIQKKYKEEKEKEQREKAHIDTELAFLRNQISPHFFFNALNNIYALIAIDGEKAQESVEKLSDLMRYLIYESDIKTVSIQKEIDFARNYIALMKQRLSKKVEIKVDIEEPKTSAQIPPLLFIPFIENVFKHGVSYRETSKIAISISTDEEFLYFHSQNAIVQNKETSIAKAGGLGVQNIQKRLKLLYNDKATLTIVEENKEYVVDLKIPLRDQ